MHASCCHCCKCIQTSQAHWKEEWLGRIGCIAALWVAAARSCQARLRRHSQWVGACDGAATAQAARYPVHAFRHMGRGLQRPHAAAAATRYPAPPCRAEPPAATVPLAAPRCLCTPLPDFACLVMAGCARCACKGMPLAMLSAARLGPRLPQMTSARAGSPLSTPARPRLQPGRPGTSGRSRCRAAQTLGSAFGVP